MLHLCINKHDTSYLDITTSMAKMAAYLALVGIGILAIPSIIQIPVLILPLMAAALCVLFVFDNFIGKGNLPPGPISFPVFGNWLQVGNDINHIMLINLAKKFGSIFLLKLGSRNLVVVSDPKLATEVLHAQGVEFGSRPRNVVFDIFTGNGQDMVFTSYGDHWRKMRRIMTVPFFTNKVVHQNREMWEREMDFVVDDLNAKTEYATRASTEGVVIRRRLQLMLYNVVYGMMFDTRFESVDDPMFKQASMFNAERSRLAQSFEYNYGDFIPILRPFLRGYLNKCKDLQTRRLAFFNNQYVEKRREYLNSSDEGKKMKCSIDHILTAEKNGEINSDNVLYIVENINVAAIETTLWSMEWAVAELVNHPEIQTKLRKEIKDVLGNEIPLTESSLQKLPYLQAVVKETLRLHSPIPLLVPHMNLEEGKLGGYTIPKESKVIVNSWWLANNPEWWNNPKEFRPERFMEEENEVEALATGKGADFRYLPFGVGRRSCPGIILALPLLGLIVGKMVSNFEMVPPPGMDKVDMTEKGGQFSLHIAKQSTVVFHQIHNI
ncbi:cinnamic acid 4-hydroxylase [Zostera marina]|uniref:Cinnamic acid 4-hydroxylase n=1 Tax=Zostera marina TaxID=29655 RepID=A0A0K9PXM5_ZOSMR|nr:cinnamic acid 4-hydroxylase [Zostera marina]